MEGIKHIIFDLGGVILNIDYSRPQQAFRELGVKNVEQLYSKQQQTGLFDLLETGRISEAEFYDSIRELAGLPLSDEAIRDAWNSILLDFPIRRLQILQQLQLHYDTYLLSNTNAIHEAAFNRSLQQTCGYPTLAVFFEKIYLSHHVGLRKPDPAIFLHVLNDRDLKPEETLFIDDSPQHIASAAALGIRTIHMADGMTMENDIFRPR